MHGRSRWSTGEAIALDELNEQQPADEISEPVSSSKEHLVSIGNSSLICEISASSKSLTKPVLAGIVIGSLLIGIALAVVVTIYVQDHSRHSTDIQHACFKES